MSNLTRWEPTREIVSLRDAMDRLFDDAFTRPLGMLYGPQFPALDLYQTESDVIIHASLPGMKADDMQISVTGELLTLKGEFKEKAEKKEKAYHLREQRFGSFERTVSLPTNVVADKAKAEFEDGILTITIPKAEEAKPRTVTVKAK